MAKFVQMLLLVLTFLKTLHFVATFEALGFFINLLISSIEKMQFFTMSYIFFALIFAVIYQVMGNEPPD